MSGIVSFSATGLCEPPLSLGSHGGCLRAHSNAHTRTDRERESRWPPSGEDLDHPVTVGRVLL